MGDLLRVLHLTGSAVSDDLDDLSRLYAAGCLAATADAERYEFHVAHVSPGGRWRFPSDVSDEAVAAAAPVTLGEALDHVRRLDVDVVLPQMFCLPGMTAYRGLLDVMGLPYVGNPSSVMALGADKAKARAVVAAAGVDVPPGRVVRPGEQVAFDRPVVVKPVDADNSLGVTLVREAGGLPGALDAAWAHSGGALVETYVELGREVRCGVLERDGELLGLPLEEYAVDTATKPVRLADDKLRRSRDGDLELVAKDVEHAWVLDLDDPLTAAVHAAAKRCHVALGCRDYSLFDFRIDPSGRPWFLEASLYNSFSPQSVLATMARSAGTGLPELFADAVHRAASR